MAWKYRPETLISRRLRPEEHELKAYLGSLGNLVRPCLKIKSGKMSLGDSRARICQHAVIRDFLNYKIKIIEAGGTVQLVDNFPSKQEALTFIISSEELSLEVYYL